MTDIQDWQGSLCYQRGHCNHKEQQLPVVESNIRVFDKRDTKVGVVCWMIYLLLNVDFHWKDRIIWQIEKLVEQLVASMINLESMSVHSTP